MLCVMILCLAKTYWYCPLLCMHASFVVFGKELKILAK